MDKLKMYTSDFVEDNIKKLADLFPNCVTEDKDEKGNVKKSIDFELLRQELSKNIVDGSQERYRLDWPGKREALLTANAPIAKTLRPCREESVDFDTTENLFIEGDNLDALKLLQETYLGKIKMIYIDPPYNTGKDFVYKDDFKQSTEEYLQESEQKDEEGNRLVANTDSNGRFHSDWLSMMYPRLKLARNLLKDDGVVFISIDDNEVHNLRKICDEIFGAENFVTNFCWEKKKKPSFLNKNLGTKFEFICVYAKNRELTGAFSVELTTEGKKYPFNNAGNGSAVLTFPPQTVSFNMSDQHVEAQDMSEGKIKTRLLNGLDIKNGWNVNEFKLEGEWRYSQNRLNEIIKNGEEIVISKVPFRPNHIKSGGEIKKMHNLLTISHYSVATNEDADSEQSSLLGGSFFDYSKPVGLIELLIKCFMYNSFNDIILDFFAGSATTAHAVMQLNAEELAEELTAKNEKGTKKEGENFRDFSAFRGSKKGKRKFIMVQLPEETDEKSEAFKAGYKTIAEISKERIRRAGKKIKEENAATASNLDIGFRVLKVDSSNMADVYYSPDAVEQNLLSLLTDNIKDDRTAEDLLFQVLLDWGVDLTLPITKETIEGREVFFVDDNALAACFVKNGEITEDFCKKLAVHQPLRVVFRDSGFKDDSVKINVEQIFKLMSPHTEVKTI